LKAAKSVGLAADTIDLLCVRVDVLLEAAAENGRGADADARPYGCPRLLARPPVWTANAFASWL
jgi:hypothetical protein